MDAEQATNIYEEIDKFQVELDPDPQGRGPKYLQERIYEGRRMLNRVSYLMSQLNQEQHELSRELRGEEASFEVESDELLATDERIRRMPSIEDRKAMINVELRDRRKRITNLNAQILDLSHVEKVVKHRHQELKTTMTDIRTQRSLIRDTLDTGAFYGTENTGDESPGIGVDDDEDFAALLDEQLGEGSESSVEDETEDVVETEEAEVVEEAEDDETEEVEEAEDDETSEVVEEAVAEADAAQDVVVSEGDEHKDDELDAEETEIAKFLDGDEEDLTSILDSV